MSDLAPFVAAALRDKVVEDLMEEVKELKKENMELRRGRIQIVSSDTASVFDGSFREDGNFRSILRTVVHAEGFLADGVAEADRGTQYSFPLIRIPLSSKTPIRLSKAANYFQVLSPGSHHKSYLATEDEHHDEHVVFPRFLEQGADSQSVVIRTHNGLDNLWGFQWTFHGFPVEQEWQRARALNSWEDHDFMTFLATHRLETPYPDATITMDNLWLCYEKEMVAIARLPEPDRTRILNEHLALRRTNNFPYDLVFE